MTIRKPITLILAIMIFVVAPAHGASKKIPMLSKVSKIKVKNSRDQDQLKVVNSSNDLIQAIKSRVVKVEASAYTLSKRETDGTPYVTATMKKPIAGKTCAVSRDQRKYLMHKTILIPGLGVREVNDTMHPRYKKSIDVVFASKKDAMKFGRKDVTIVVLN